VEIRTRAVLVASGIDREGRRQLMTVGLANRGSATEWRDFLIGFKQGGVPGVHRVVTDGHEDLKKAVAEVLPLALWQRCCVHFVRNALDCQPRSAERTCLQELRWLYALRNAVEARAGLNGWLERWQDKLPLSVRVGGGEHQGPLHLLPAGPRAPQAPQVAQPARTAQPGVQGPQAHRALLPRRTGLPAAGPRARGRDTRGQERRQPLSQQGSPAPSGRRASTNAPPSSATSSKASKIALIKPHSPLD
jgi:hypothetical protein